MVVRALAYLLLLLCAACVSAPPLEKIVLLAPFEGRQRDLGYEALYAVRLALAESDTSLHLLAIDSGTAPNAYQAHLRAINQDPAVRFVLLVGDDGDSNKRLDWLERPFHWIQAQEFPPPDFVERYQASAEFAPPASPLAYAAYQATQALIADLLNDVRQ